MRKSTLFTLLLALGAFVLLWFARLAFDYYDPTSVAHQSMQFHLKLFGSAIYEYHQTAGQWPASLDDLAHTSLPQRSPYWRQAAGTVVFLWPQDLSASPRENARRLLAYDHGGLFNHLGKVWVCWGDLRTEHLPEQELRDRLAKR